MLSLVYAFPFRSCCSKTNRNPRIAPDPGHVRHVLVQNPDKTVPGENDRIVFIGAGPSSLHMAHLLVKRGYNAANFTFLERAGRFGGKTLSVPHSSLDGVVHELGTCFLSADYDNVRELVSGSAFYCV